MTVDMMSAQPESRLRTAAPIDRIRRRPDLSARALATRVTTLALWLLVCSSAMAGFVALSRVNAAAPPAHVPPAGLEGFAELYVAAWLEGSALQGFHPGAPAAAPAPSADRFVSRVAAVGIRPTGRGAWSVTVGAEVLVAADGGYRRDGTHYFEAMVVQDGDALVATALPSEVPAPSAPPRG
jgi:hypothetical protein